MDTVEITDEQLSAIFSRPEGHFSDFKSKRLRPASLPKVLTSFANADGGEIFVGLEDPREGVPIWDGFDSPEHANGHIQQFDKIFPLGSGLNYSFLTHPKESGYVLQIEIQKHRDIINTPDGKTYVRRGARNHPISTSEEVTRLKLNKGIVSYEDHSVNVPLEIVENSTHVIEFMLDIVPDRDPHEWLGKQLLIVGENPTVAALLLFAEEPQVALPKAAVKIYRYKTIEPEGSRDTLAGDPETIEGNSYHQIFQSVDRVREITRKIPVVGSVGMESIEFPKVALHEVIANAVLHRDYSIDDAVHVRIFDNRIEVESPGFPGSTVRTRFGRIGLPLTE